MAWRTVVDDRRVHEKLPVVVGKRRLTVAFTQPIIKSAPNASAASNVQVTHRLG
jgi:hypothetical protein